MKRAQTGTMWLLSAVVLAACATASTGPSLDGEAGGAHQTTAGTGGESGHGSKAQSAGSGGAAPGGTAGAQAGSAAAGTPGSGGSSGGATGPAAGAGGGGEGPGAGGAGAGGESAGAGGESAGAGDGGAVSGGGGGVAGAGPKALPKLEGFGEHCKLINENSEDDPTANQTHVRANLRASDLGIPVRHGDDLFVFFGDTAGSQFIWPLGPESLPDAVGYSAVGYAEVAKNPAALCQSLRFLLTGGKSGDVEGDFAAGNMAAPPGHSIAEFIHNPSGPRGKNMFPTLPGDFEVPSGAFSYQGSIYLFYTTVNLDPFEMRGSYLARWQAPSTKGKPDYQILHHVDERFDDKGPLRGDFIQIAPLIVGDHIYLYGTGKYRASPVHLARKPLSKLETEGGFERYDAAKKAWVDAKSPASPIVTTPSIGELSVQYFPAIGRYMMINQEVTLGNRLAARFAEAPEGPWSEPVTVARMDDPGFVAQFCCLGDACPGERIIQCDKAGFYAPYLLPDLAVNADGSFTVSFFLSTWKPYNVALMHATFH